MLMYTDPFCLNIKKEVVLKAYRPLAQNPMFCPFL